MYRSVPVSCRPLADMIVALADIQGRLTHRHRSSARIR
jgi:hypothetical protein